jgi:transposase
MSGPPITPEQLAALPPEFRALLQGVIDYYEVRIARLEADLAAARKTPANSSLPPGTQHPHAKPAPTRPRSKRRRGGQPGHPKHDRALIPTADCQAVAVLQPAACRGCGESLTGTDPTPLRHQVWDLPEIRPQVTEYQRHRLSCGGCGRTTCAELPPGVPASQAGPQLVALTALLMGCFRQSKRRVALFLTEILHQPCSPGWVVKLQRQATAALRPAYDELQQALPAQPVVGGDETPTKQGPTKAWLWTFVAPAFTVFAVRPTRANTAVTDLLGPDFPGVVVCDRAKMYWCAGRLQWCWAHLTRDFRAWADHPDGVAKRLGQDLLRQTKAVFGLWPRVRDGTLGRAAFARAMGPIRRAVEALLLRGTFSGVRGVAGSCRELWDHRDCLWRFVDEDGVEPTNNASERALRPAVIWRKLSFGTQSAAGSRFVETLLSVIETCRQQERSAIAFVRDAVARSFRKQAAPSLLAGV